MKKSTILFALLFLGFVFWQFYISRFEYGHVSPLNKPAPEFQAESVRDGTLLELKSLIGKKVVLVNFWATWCDTCRLEIPTLNALQQSLDPNSFQIVSFVEDEASDLATLQALVADFNKKIPVDFPLYRDAEFEVARLYGTFKIPESYLIDLKGNVVEYHNGAIFPDDLEKLVTKIETLLKK